MQKGTFKINREIRALALPNIISNVSVPLISSVDTFLMGQLSAASVVAVGVGSMIFNFLYWNMGFLRMGTTGMTAQAFGRQDQAETSGVLLKAALLGLVISLLFVLFQVPLFNMASWAIQADGSEIVEVWSYYGIRIYGAPASLLLMVMMGWLFGMQNAKFPLWITLFINIVNIVASVYLVRGLGLGAKGAAWGTLLAQYLGVLLCGILIAWRYGSLFQRAAFSISMIFDKMTALLQINRDIFIRTLFLSTAFLLIFRFSKDAGPNMLAINVVFMQFLNWMSYAIDGFAYAAESLVGKYKGARNEFMIKLAIRWNMIWGFVFAMLFSMVYGIFAEDIFELFMESDKGVIVKTAEQYFIWMAIMPLVGFASYIWDGIFVGLTASVSMRNSMFAAFVVYIISYLLIPVSYENHRIWIAFFLFLIARGAFQWYLFRQNGWEHIR
jgi:MATE family multidrug resistance protein